MEFSPSVLGNHPLSKLGSTDCGISLVTDRVANRQGFYILLEFYLLGQFPKSELEAGKKNLAIFAINMHACHCAHTDAHGIHTLFCEVLV